MKNHRLKSAVIYQLTALVFVLLIPGVHGQEEMLSAPVPGVNLPESNLQNVAPQQSSQVVTESNDTEKEKALAIALEKYPISISGLKSMLDQYKQQIEQSDFNAMNLDEPLLWLDNLLRAHNRLAHAFAKQSDLKPAYENECSLIRQLRSIKNEMLYLKAQNLIKEKKLKRAIPILVDIVCTEPNSPLGQKAYQHLKQSGFSVGNNTILAKPDEIKANNPH